MENCEKETKKGIIMNLLKLTPEKATIAGHFKIQKAKKF